LSDDYSVALWFYLNDTSRSFLLSQSTAYYVDVEGGVSQASIKLSGGREVFGSVSTSLSTWHQLTFVKTDTVLELFLDGASQGTKTVGVSETFSLTDVSINNATFCLNGKEDDVYIWGRALSLDEIKALASTRNYFDCPVVSAIIQTRRRRLALAGGML